VLSLQMGDADLASGRTGAEGGAAGAATKPAPTGGASGSSSVMVTDDGPGPEPPISFRGLGSLRSRSVGMGWGRSAATSSLTCSSVRPWWGPSAADCPSLRALREDRRAWCTPHQDGMFLVMARPKAAPHEDGPVARTIRFPEGLRTKIAADADRCGRSFESQAIAILRRHYGEDVDIAPAPSEILALAAASLAGVSERDVGRLTRRLRESGSE
jgi:hypothetical protein